MLVTPPATLMGARPSSTRPPQSPGARLPAAMLEVNTMGLVAVPWASIVALEVTTSAEAAPAPAISVPASMVSVPPVT